LPRLRPLLDALPERPLHGDRVRRVR